MPEVLWQALASYAANPRDAFTAPELALRLGGGFLVRGSFIPSVGGPTTLAATGQYLESLPHALS